ncbi:glycosyltransferase involved in cell wall biosynthesis [Dysgonomonadaceae bacterium PH5-43]|nr:glycosyltransferase involved in cell wall biosynthesis [Dysgonomonadaceae bacterium PH5-43]
MNKNIKVSIITPSYNQGQFIEHTIKSVLNQTYKNIEYIVVDGGSTDNTMEIVDRYRDKIDIVIHEKDKGQSDAINKGFKLATGTLLGWINSDDVLYPDCVEKLVEKYNAEPDGAVYYNSKLDFIDSKGNYLKTWNFKIPSRKHLLKTHYFVIQPTSFYSKEILDKINYLDEDLYYCMDLDLWLRLLEYKPIIEVGNTALGALRDWEETKSNTGNVKFLTDIRKTLLKHGANIWDKSVLKTYKESLKFYAPWLFKRK